MSSITIAIDIGNSGLRAARIAADASPLGAPCRIHWLHPSASLSRRFTGMPSGSVADGTVLSDDRYPPDSQAWFPCLAQWLATSILPTDHQADQERVQWWVSSVRRDALEQLRIFIDQRPHHSLHVIRYSDVPMIAAVDHPERLGIDRLLAAYAASQMVAQRPILVIQAGSAVTVDLVERHSQNQDRFSGGAILPGVPMMLRLLGQAADMLPELDADDLTELPTIPGKNTEAAMLCGTASCLIGGVQHVVGRFREIYGAEVQVVMSGGDGSRLVPNLLPPVVVIPDLVLRGISILSNGMQ